MAYSYEYPRPAMSCDCLIFGFDGNNLNLLLIERFHEPYAHYWALPGGFMEMDETTQQCAQRELFEETNLSGIELEPLGVYDNPPRDPRGRVVSVAFTGFVSIQAVNPVAGDDAALARWFDIKTLPPLAFDHKLMFTAALNKLRKKLRFYPFGKSVLPGSFSENELNNLYKSILNATFSEKELSLQLLNLGIINKCPDSQNSLLFSFNLHQYEYYSTYGYLLNL